MNFYPRGRFREYRKVKTNGGMYVYDNEYDDRDEPRRDRGGFRLFDINYNVSRQPRARSPRRNGQVFNQYVNFDRNRQDARHNVHHQWGIVDEGDDDDPGNDPSYNSSRRLTWPERDQKELDAFREQNDILRARCNSVKTLHQERERRKDDQKERMLDDLYRGFEADSNRNRNQRRLMENMANEARNMSLLDLNLDLGRNNADLAAVYTAMGRNPPALRRRYG